MFMRLLCLGSNGSLRTCMRVKATIATYCQVSRKLNLPCFNYIKCIKHSKKECANQPIYVGSIRWASTNSVKKRSTMNYMIGVTVLVFGLSYAAVPMYRLYCQSTSYGGQIKTGHDDSKVEGMKKVKHRTIEITFNADTASTLAWNFKPQQPNIFVSPGETALIFYTATNPTNRPITGIATYNVTPFEAGQYFNKIQCFCFEEQRLNPHEQVDMPVFFYLDPAYAEDPKLENVNIITLSYMFFEAKEGLFLPTPSYAIR